MSNTTRIDAILALPEAQGQAALAKHVAFATTLSVDQARAALAKSAGYSSWEAAIDEVNREGARTYLGFVAPVGAHAGTLSALARSEGRAAFNSPDHGARAPTHAAESWENIYAALNREAAAANASFRAPRGAV